MRFYTKQHQYYCGIDLHTKKMYVCILNSSGETVAHRNLNTDPGAFLEFIASYREDIVVAAECMFTWFRGALRAEVQGTNEVSAPRSPGCAKRVRGNAARNPRRAHASPPPYRHGGPLAVGLTRLLGGLAQRLEGRDDVRLPIESRGALGKEHFDASTRLAVVGCGGTNQLRSRRRDNRVQTSCGERIR